MMQAKKSSRALVTILKCGLLLVAAGLLLGLAPAGPASPNADNETLRSYADKLGFGVGVFVQPRWWKRDPRHKQIIEREFNRAVAYAVMIQDQRGHFDFDFMDEEMKMAREHNMKLFGAGLIYRSTASPAWLHFMDRNCGGWSRGDIDRIMKEQITTIVHHGGDLFYAWEVVNEPVSPGHNGCWSFLMGGQDNMIARASQYAHEANPNVPVFLNDAFGQEGVDRAKVDDMMALIKRVRAMGGHIDGVGSEMHLEAHRLHPNYVDEFKYFLDQCRQNHLEAQVTEMDVYQGPAGAFEQPFENQKNVFYNIAHACLKDSNCSTFAVWGLYDTATWLHEAKGLTDAKPLLFDDNFDKKPAYYGVLQALKEGR